jgi:AbrB family looped-hinge helix DNA binding protein
MAFCNGKMPLMNAITEIDKAGRLVVPKKLRDALHLVPGTRVLLHQEGESIILQTEPQSKGLYLKDGTWVYDAGGPFPGDIRDWIEKDREDRDRIVLRDLKAR